jgi:peptidoglycan hydrolase-like protein with peptidoglycan-binding domain
MHCSSGDFPMRALVIALAICIAAPAYSQDRENRTFDQDKINALLDKRDPLRRQSPLPNAAKPSGAVATLPTSNSTDAPQTLSDKPSINCAKVPANRASSAVARILCSGKDGAAADWDLNAVLWAIAGTINAIEQKALDRDQDRWRDWLNKRCFLLPVAVGISQEQQRCVTSEFHSRAAVLRSKLSGDVLAESRLTPEQHAQIQESLIARGLLQAKADGEFGNITRQSIKKFQEAEGAEQTGVLTQDQMSRLRPNNQPQNPDSQNDPLSDEEIGEMRQALAKNWNASGYKGIVRVRVRLNPDGTLAAPPQVVSTSDDPNFASAAASAMQAVQLSQPYRMLKPSSYGTWRYMDVDFDPSKLNSQMVDDAEAKVAKERLTLADAKAKAPSQEKLAPKTRADNAEMRGAVAEQKADAAKCTLALAFFASAAAVVLIIAISSWRIFRSRDRIGR